MNAYGAMQYYPPPRSDNSMLFFILIIVVLAVVAFIVYKSGVFTNTEEVAQPTTPTTPKSDMAKYTDLMKQTAADTATKQYVNEQKLEQAKSDAETAVETAKVESAKEIELNNIENNKALATAKSDAEYEAAMSHVKDVAAAIAEIAANAEIEDAQREQDLKDEIERLEDEDEIAAKKSELKVLQLLREAKEINDTFEERMEAISKATELEKAEIQKEVDISAAESEAKIKEIENEIKEQIAQRKLNAQQCKTECLARKGIFWWIIARDCDKYCRTAQAEAFKYKHTRDFVEKFEKSMQGSIYDKNFSKYKALKRKAVLKTKEPMQISSWFKNWGQPKPANSQNNEPKGIKLFGQTIGGSSTSTKDPKRPTLWYDNWGQPKETTSQSNEPKGIKLFGQTIPIGSKGDEAKGIKFFGQTIGGSSTFTNDAVGVKSTGQGVSTVFDSISTKALSIGEKAKDQSTFTNDAVGVKSTGQGVSTVFDKPGDSRMLLKENFNPFKSISKFGNTSRSSKCSVCEQKRKEAEAIAKIEPFSPAEKQSAVFPPPIIKFFSLKDWWYLYRKWDPITQTWKATEERKGAVAPPPVIKYYALNGDMIYYDAWDSENKTYLRVHKERP